VAVADVADVVSFVIERRPAVALNAIRVQPAIEDDERVLGSARDAN
jgi:NADP-dependent 3-hydroxy acid dehydrogenase YdfG